MACVFVALSGGIDSSVAACTLKNKGNNIAGIYMKHGYQPTLSPDETRLLFDRIHSEHPLTIGRFEKNGSFQSHQFDPKTDSSFRLPVDAARAFELAARFHFPFFLFDASEPFESIVDNFVEEYFNGRTPNPCVLCNKTLKFGQLVDAALHWGAERFATGHYVRIRLQEDWMNDQSSETIAAIPDWLTRQASTLPLLENVGHGKDQSYVLYRIRRELLPILTFPLADWNKEHVREIAAELNLTALQQKESQDICFVENGKHFEFLAERDSRPTEGNFVSLDGKIIGQHPGYQRYTIGQRKGLRTGFGERIFVQRINPERREVVLGPYNALAQSEIKANDSNWHVELPTPCEFRCSIKIRYRTKPIDALVQVDENGSITAFPDTPCYGAAPGQSLVCFLGNRLLGGGTILLPTL